jgi:protein pelota
LIFGFALFTELVHVIMKLIGKNFSKNGEGDITLIAENEEDIWMVYNLLQEGDSIRASTVRKVHNESMTGSVATKQVRLNLTISIESITYDSLGSSLHLKGRNLEENKHVKLGAYHTLDISINEKFTLRKPEWDTVAVDLVEEACDPTRQADVAAVIMQDGLAHVCLITPSTTLIRAKIDVVIPKKRGEGKVSQHKKGMERFFSQIMQAIERHVKFDIVKCVILAVPVFSKMNYFNILYTRPLNKRNVFFWKTVVNFFWFIVALAINTLSKKY